MLLVCQAETKKVPVLRGDSIASHTFEITETIQVSQLKGITENFGGVPHLCCNALIMYTRMLQRTKETHTFYVVYDRIAAPQHTLGYISQITTHLPVIQIASHVTIYVTSTIRAPTLSPGIRAY